MDRLQPSSTTIAIRRLIRRIGRAERTRTFESSELDSLRPAVSGFSCAASILVLAMLGADVLVLAPGLSAAGVSSAVAAVVLLLIGLTSGRLPSRWLQWAFFAAATLSLIAVTLLQLEEQPDQVFGFHLTAMLPVAAAAFARWSLRRHFGWLAVTLAGLIAMQLGRAQAGLELDSSGQMIVSWFVGAVVSMAVLMALRLERYHSFVLLRRIAAVSQRAVRARIALSESLEEVRQSRLMIRKLEGILPVCATCGRVRTDDDSQWLPLADYLVGRGAVSMSHGYCPDCYAQLVTSVFGSE